MIKLYYSRASINREKFIFEKIRDEITALSGSDSSRILYIVPDQYTITAERVAFENIPVDGFMNLDILSFSRLMARIVEETTRSEKVHIDKYGRHMLLEKIIGENGHNFEAFKGISPKPSFIEMVNNFISEMKQFNTSPDDLIEIIQESKDKEILKRKIRDIYRIFSEYEKAIAGKYLDTEDFINLVSENVKNSNLVKDSCIYFQGFDYFSPKSLKVIEMLAIHSKGINIVLQNDPEDKLFDLSKFMISKINEFALKIKANVEEVEIPESYKYNIGMAANQRCPEIAFLERQLYAFPYTKFDLDNKSKAIQLYACSNYYTEVENAAIKIVEFTRDSNYKYDDIIVVCNDLENRESIIKRVFLEYNIPYFIDAKKNALQNPFIKFITSLLLIQKENYRFEDIFTLIKTGLTPIETNMADLLENYAFEYKLSKRNWISSFKYYKRNTNIEILELINMEREKLVKFILEFQKPFEKANTVREKITCLYEFLANTVDFPNKALNMSDSFKENGQEVYGEEFGQIWDVILHVMDQMVELIGEDVLNTEAFFDMISTGFNSAEIGIIPQAVDKVMIGNVQRTRTKDIKALIVMGANDGILPQDNVAEDLLNEDEKQFLFDKKYEFCKNDNFRKMEESLAIYSMLSKPMECLYLSFSASDKEGKEMRPSNIFEKIRKIFPRINVEREFLSANDELDKISSKRSGLRYLTYELRENPKDLSSLWKLTFNWFNKDAKANGGITESRMENIKAGLMFENHEENIGKEIVQLLYGKGEKLDLVLSSSRIESFSKCPFAYLINYGLRIEERKLDQVAGREMGDIYHECLMRLSKDFTDDNIEITSNESRWMEVTKEQCKNSVEEIIRNMEKDYINPDLDSAANNKYRFQRIVDVCSNSAWEMINQVRAGQIKDIFFEAEFGLDPKKPFREIKVDLGDDKLFIEGKIDRVDVVKGEKENYIKVIDYKSGSDKYSQDEALGGIRIQLLLYLKAASESLNLKPGAAFYFPLDKPLIDMSKLSDSDAEESEPENSDGKALITEKIKKEYKMDGIMLREMDLIDSIDSNFIGSSKIIPAFKKKDGEISENNNLLSNEDLEQLQQGVDQKIQIICKEMLEGNVEINPKKIKNNITACSYCPFKSICTFDTCFKNNKYNTLQG
jgi:ATP-dependent helicase/nuclease subunit B